MVVHCVTLEKDSSFFWAKDFGTTWRLFLELGHSGIEALLINSKFSFIYFLHIDV